jgi:hypothetical protein
MASRGSTPERAILAGLMRGRPDGGLVALDSVSFGTVRPTATGRLVEVVYHARHSRERLPPEDREHRETYEVTQSPDGRWEATARA